jgi:hypothetical protein
MLNFQAEGSRESGSPEWLLYYGRQADQVSPGKIVHAVVDQKYPTSKQRVTP